MNNVEIISEILGEELAPARAEALAKKIARALPVEDEGAVSKTMIDQAIDLLKSARPGAKAPAAAKSKAKAPAKAKTKTPKAKSKAKPKAKGGGLGLTPAQRELVKKRAQLRWARVRIAKNEAAPGDKGLVKRLEAELHPKAAKTAAKAGTRRPAAPRAPKPAAEKANGRTEPNGAAITPNVSKALPA